MCTDKRLPYLPQLDGLRALAAIAVVIVHLPIDFGVGGYVGVDVFFVLSGYLITTILRSEAAATGTIDLKDFYVRRLRRLTPVLLVCSLFVVQAFLVIDNAPEQRDTAIGGLLATTYLGGWARGFRWATLGALAHTWSLSVEEHFYLAWPLVVRWFARRSTNALLWGAVGLFALSSAEWIYGYASGWSLDRLVYAPDTRAKDLLVGCILALAIERGLLSSAPPRWLGTAALGALGLWVFAAPKSATVYLIGWPLIHLASAVAVWGLAVDGASAASRALSARRLVWVGKRSYGIYLWHFPLMTLNVAVLDWSAPSRVLVGAATIIGSFVLAAWSYRFVEQPIRDGAYGSVSFAELRDYLGRTLRRQRSTRRAVRLGEPARSL